MVVGGGVAGLAAAWELTTRAPEASVVVLEAAGRLGGKIGAAAFAGRTLDTGADAFLARRPEALALCQELGMADELVQPGSRQAFVWHGDRLVPLPPRLALGVPTDARTIFGSGLLSAGGMVRAVGGALLPRLRPIVSGDGDRAVGEIVGRVLGREVVETITDPLVGGIHAGMADGLSAAAVFPPLNEAAGHRGRVTRRLRKLAPPPADPQTPVFLAPRAGVHRLVTRLAEALQARGVELHTGVQATSVEANKGTVTVRDRSRTREADAVVVAVPARPAAALIRTIAPTAADVLGSVTSSSVALVTLRFDEADVGAQLTGTGFLVPRTSGSLMTACTFLTSKWPQLWHAGDVLVRASLGHDGDERPAALDDDELVRTASFELAPALGLRASPLEAMVVRITDAFPQYRPGHLDRVAAAEAALAGAAPVAMAGAALRGVGIPACIQSGRRAAGMVLERVSAGAPA